MRSIDYNFAVCVCYDLSVAFLAVVRMASLEHCFELGMGE
jgi:hypothetical protein